MKLKGIHVECGKYLRASNLFFGECQGGVHVQMKSSDIFRKPCNDIRSAKVKWKCDGCKGIIANLYPNPEDNTEVVYKLGKDKRGKQSLEILQWNTDAYL